MNSEEIISKLKSFSNKKNVEGMARFGINPKNTLGVSMPIIRGIAKKTGKNHSLAIKLWNSRIHEARILAALIDVPSEVTEKQMDLWARQFDSWDVCDQACMNLFDKTEFAYTKAIQWSRRKEEFVKRAGFALMASLASHDKRAKDKDFMQFFHAIKREADDERNFVRKAVNWALRGIGKRNISLNKTAIRVSKEIFKNKRSKSAKWIASDALKELQSLEVRKRLNAKSSR